MGWAPGCARKELHLPIMGLRLHSQATVCFQWLAAGRKGCAEGGAAPAHHGAVPAFANYCLLSMAGSRQEGMC
eukprot:1151142-Pelagomonas_calceolata.AAC.2